MYVGRSLPLQIVRWIINYCPCMSVLFNSTFLTEYTTHVCTVLLPWPEDTTCTYVKSTRHVYSYCSVTAVVDVFIEYIMYHIHMWVISRYSDTFWTPFVQVKEYFWKIKVYYRKLIMLHVFSIKLSTLISNNMITINM